MSNYATLQDVLDITGQLYNEQDQARIDTLLPLVSSLIRQAGYDAGKDVDAHILKNPAYGDVVKLVTVDVVVRAIRQDTTGEPLSQESQSALGYTWSGSYAVPGGGVAMSLMENEKKTLGFKRQRFGSITLWPRPRYKE